jgi:hypothetical protein
MPRVMARRKEDPMRIALIATCLGDALFPGVAKSTTILLLARGLGDVRATLKARP